MTKSAIAYDIEKYLVLTGIPRGPKSRIFFVDPVNGSNNNTGTSWLAPLATLTAAYALCVDAQHDVVVMLSGATADNPAAAITWSKNYTHLIGLSSNLPGVGSGCIIRNIQFYNGKDANSASYCVDVTGSRNEFKNCFFAGMAHATPAALAASYSLKVAGDENLFDDCAIGLDTIVRAQSNCELYLASGAARNVFRHCRFLSYSETAAKVLVLAEEGIDRWNEFDECIFQNFSVNWAQPLNNAFSVTASSTHQIILRGLNQLVGVTGWADTVTHIYSAAPVSNAGFGVTVSPTT
jgi:hypothetical protein